MEEYRVEQLSNIIANSSDYQPSTKCQDAHRESRGWLKLRELSIGRKLTNGSQHSKDQQSKKHFEHVSCAVKLCKIPNLTDYLELKRKIKQNNRIWISDFVRSDGLAILLEALEKLCAPKSTSLVDVFLQLECIECIKAVMNSENGLECIIENRDFSKKFALALDTSNRPTKKQFFELLSAVCLYSKEGYAFALDALKHYKDAKNCKYRFSLLLDELQQGETPAYLATILAFINCIILSTDKLEDRVRLRNEFIGLKLLEVLHKLRNLEDQDPDLVVQLDVFEEERANDEESLPHPAGAVDLSNHLDVFNAVYKQVCDTRQDAPFLAILQHFLQIDIHASHCDVIWNTIEKLVYRATLLEEKENPEKVLHSGSKRLEKITNTNGDCQCNCHRDDTDSFGNSTLSPKVRRRSSAACPGQTATNATLPPPPPPPPPLPSMGAVPPPPPAPPLPGMNTMAPPPPPPPPLPFGAGMPPPPPPIGGLSGGGPPPPPPMGGMPGAPPAFGFMQQTVKLPQQDTPTPKTKMRKLQWNKIPANRVVGKDNMWTKAGKVFKKDNEYQVDFEKIEELFAVSNPADTAKSKDMKDSQAEKKKKEEKEVNLLDGKRNLNVSIFLRQFRMSHSEIIEILMNGLSEQIGAEKLRGLLKILPEQDEVEMLKSFSGDMQKLGNAEKFFMELLAVPQYTTRIEALLIKEEFANTLDWIKPSIDAVILTSRDLKDCKSLHEIIYLVLLAGNFLNAGGYAGDAAGFKLTSLLKLTEIRANKPRMNLMHYVVMQAEAKDTKLLNFPKEFKYLKEASLVSVDSLKSEITAIQNKLKSISDQIVKTDQEFQELMAPVMENMKEEMKEIDEDLAEMDTLKKELADYFCEEESSFKIEECIKIFRVFCDKFTKAIEENKDRNMKEEKAELRRKQREEQITAKKRTTGEDKVSVSKRKGGRTNMEEANIVDKLLGDIKIGEFTQKKNMDAPPDSPTETHPPDVRTDSKKEEFSGENGRGNLKTTESTDNSSGDFVRVGSLRSKKGTARLSSIDEARPESPILTSLKNEDDQKRNRSSGEFSDSEDLINILINGEKDEGRIGLFERSHSMRRSRSRRQKLDTQDRERASSPSLDNDNKSPKNLATKLLERTACNSPARGPSPLTLSENSHPHSTVSPISRSTSALSPSTTLIQTVHVDKEKLSEREMMHKERQRRSIRKNRQLKSPISDLVSESQNSDVSSSLKKSVTEESPQNDNVSLSKSESDSSVLTTLNTALKEEKTSEPTKTLAGLERRNTLRQLKFSNGELDQEKLQSALQKIENTKSDEFSTGNQYGPSVQTAAHLERHKARERKARLSQASIEPADVDAVLKKIERTASFSKDRLRSESSQNGDDILTDLESSHGSNIENDNVFTRSATLPRRHKTSPYRANRTIPQIEKTDVDDIIKDVLKTGQEIDDMDIGSTNDINSLSERTSLKPTRQERFSVDKADVVSALRGQGLHGDVSKPRHLSEDPNMGRQDNEFKSHTLPRRLNHSVSLNEGVKRDTRGDTGYNSLDNSETGAALRDRLDEDLKHTYTQKALLAHSSGEWKGNSTNNNADNLDQTRPYSTYDNFSGHAARKRWSKYLDSDKDKNDTDIKVQYGSPLSPKADDPGYHSLDRSLPGRRSLRLTTLTTGSSLTGKADLGTTPSPTQKVVLAQTIRTNTEQVQLDSNVQSFQDKLGAKNKVRNSKLKGLSALYSNDTDDDWSPRSSTVAPSNNSPRNSNLAEETLAKTETDSNASSSLRDEGFETESSSDPSVSQRTSMSSTLDAELSGTPTMGREDYSNTPSEEADNEGTGVLICRSFDSLVKGDLALSESKNESSDEEAWLNPNDRTPTNEENKLQVWNDSSDHRPEDVEETWTETTEVIMTPMNALDPEIREALMKDSAEEKPPAPPIRSTSKSNLTSSKPSPIHSKTTLKSPSKVATKKSSETKSKSSLSIKSPFTRSGSITSSRTKSPTPSSLPYSPRSSGRLQKSATSKTGQTNHSSNSSVASENSSTTTTSTSVTRPPRRTSVQKTDVKAPVTSSFVRQGLGRATMPASVLRTNKQAARESKEAPVPPKRSSSIRASERLNFSTPGKTVDKKETGIRNNTMDKKMKSVPSSPAKSEVKPARSNSVFNRLSAPKNKMTPTENKPPVSRPKELNGRPKDLQLKTSRTAKPDGPVKPKTDSVSDKSPSIIKRFMDKTAMRKSPLNKNDGNPLTRTSVNLSKSRASKC